MRFTILAAGLLIAASAAAQTTTAPTTSAPSTPAPSPSAPATPAPATPAPTTPAPAAPAKPAVTKPKPVPRTEEQRFDAANTTHDGKLTLAQATSAKWVNIRRNFAAIDKDKKGYVTQDDIKAYNAAKKAAKPAPVAPKT